MFRKSRAQRSSPINPGPVWAVLGMSLLGLAACGETPNGGPGSGPTIPAAGLPSVEPAARLERSPVAAGSYRIEAGNPHPVPVTEATGPTPASARGATDPAQALSVRPLEALNEIVVQPGLPPPSVAGMAGPAAHGLRR
jgi:hypothetical protein